MNELITKTNGAELTVLVLEDSIRDMELLHEQLLTAGYCLDLTHVDNETAFTSILRKKCFNLILADFNLPGFDAFGALRISQELCPGTPFICVSGTIGEETAVELLKQGAVDYVLKDRPERLPMAVKRALEEAEVKADYQKAVEALRESEENIRSIYSVAPIGIGVVADRVLKEVNPRICEMTGYTREELIEKDARILYPSQEEYDFVGNEKYVQIRAKGTGEVETHWQIKDGSIINVLLASTPIDPSDYSKGVIFTALDITERKLAEERLRKSEERFRVAQEMSPDGFTILHPVRNEKGEIVDFTFIYENQTIARINGTDPQKVIGKRLLELFPNHRGLSVFETYLYVANTGNPRILEDVYVGEVISKPTWLRLVVVSMGQDIAILSHDMTERKRAEEALYESEEKYRRIAENVADVVWITDLDMNPTYISPSIERVFGVKPEDFLKLPLTQAYPPASLKMFQKTLAEEFAKEQDPEVDKNRIFQLEAEHYYSDGTIGWDAISAAFIRDEQSNPIAIQGVSRDITERKQAEEALRESEHNFKELYDDAPVCYHEIDIEGRIIRVNKTETALLGYTQEEMTGKHFWEFLVEDQREMSKEAIKEKITTKEVSTGIERDIVCKRGEILTFFIRDSLVLNTDGKVMGIRSTLENITERKRAEMIRQMQYNIANAVITAKSLNDLFASINNELNNVIDARNIYIALYDEKTGMFNSIVDHDETGEMPEWPAEKSLTGYVVRQNRPMLLRKEEIRQLHREGIIDLIGSTTEAWLGVPLKIEGEVLGAVVVQNYDNPDAYDQASIEIMELAAHELSIFFNWQRAEEKATKLSRAVEQSSVSVMISNKEGLIEYVNPFFTELTGYSLEEVIGKNSNIMNSGHHPKAFYEELWNTIISGNDWEGEMLNKKKNGELYWEKAYISPIVNSEGVIKNFVAINENITERKKMIEELVAAKEKAQESDKLKTAFLNNISHEIRTPLNGILGFGALLLETDPSPQDKKEMLAIVQQSSTRLMNTVADYLDMARIVSGTMEVHRKEFFLQPFFEEVMEETRPLCALKQINLEPDYQLYESGLALDSGPELIRKILHILLDNALKFTSRGSIGCGYKLKDGFVEFFVRDTGKGIVPEMLDAIFNTFTQADPLDTRGYEGSGLGLSIASGLVKLLGGTISVISKPGIGSTFAFTVPCTATALAEKAPARGNKNDAVAGKPLVILAEDEESNYMYMEAVLKLAKCDFLLANNGEEAVAFCKQRPEISLVLMDIKMPVMNGLEATMLIREFRPELPIIATTAYAQTGDEQRFLDAGCDGYLVKPIGKEKLLKLLQKYVKS